MDTVTAISDAWDIRLDNYLLGFALVGVGSIFVLRPPHYHREIKYVWGRPKMLSAYLFLANRYFSFLANIVVVLFQVINFNLLQRFEISPNAKLISQVASPKLQEIQPVATAFPYCKSILGTSYNDIAGVVSLGVTGWALFGQQTTVAPKLSGCHIGLERDTSMRLAVVWAVVFAYDSIIFALTLAKTWQAARKIRIHTRLPIIALLLRDGAIYFAVMALANLANILTFFFCGPFLQGGLSTFASSISVTMTSRLMLNLHETASIGIFSGVSALGPISRPEFFNESLAISELLAFQESAGGAVPQENSAR
ncbi:hypothetical protein BD779DRAFT_1678691 [Infundibulicybe gibba]|nr:hypothetical protein BD779DRAFT_1678691 [Infundibulicybe gibba]